MTPGDFTPFFFIHVMKTGGSSLAFQLQQNFEPEQIYPADVDMRFPGDVEAYGSVPRLLETSATRRRAIRLYAGHFPYVASELLGGPVRRVTMVREPVARTISMLSHLQRFDPECEGLSFDAIYERDSVRGYWLDNHQTKLFALTPADYHRFRAALACEPAPEPEPQSDSPAGAAMDPKLVSQAKEHLANVEAIGVSERYSEFLAELQARFGWWPDGLPPIARRNASPHEPAVSKTLRRRIAADNRHDLEFYEYARELIHARRTAP